MIELFPGTVSRKRPIVLGAGVAGLSCAYEMSRRGVPVWVVERKPVVGGLCRTVEFEGCLFDIGGHRFLSKNHRVNRLWHEMLKSDLLRVKRKSRIFYQGQYFDYPLNPGSSFKTLGFSEAALCSLSFLGGRLFPPGDVSHFEGWMTRHFGKRLYKIFFKDYTEKLWGLSCRDLSSDWALQRIQGLSLTGFFLRMFTRGRSSPKTLCNEFYYPAKGPGSFCEKLRQSARAAGSEFYLDTDVVSVRTSADRAESVLLRSRTGQEAEVSIDSLFSSIPLPQLVRMFSPEAPSDVLAAADKLTFRSFISVNLIFDEKELFPDNWVYIHSPKVSAVRVQNYKNWSPYMVANPDWTSLGVEYFTEEKGRLWNLADDELIELALDELERIGLAPKRRIIDGFVMRVADAYPIYRLDYRQSVETIRRFLEGFNNIHVMGRSGLFRYDNSDHAILTGLNAASNYLGERRAVWDLDMDRLGAEEVDSADIL